MVRTNKAQVKTAVLPTLLTEEQYKLGLRVLSQSMGLPEVEMIWQSHSTLEKATAKLNCSMFKSSLKSRYSMMNKTTAQNSMELFLTRFLKNSSDISMNYLKENSKKEIENTKKEWQKSTQELQNKLEDTKKKWQNKAEDTKKEWQKSTESLQKDVQSLQNIVEDLERQAWVWKTMAQVGCPNLKLSFETMVVIEETVMELIQHQPLLVQLVRSLENYAKKYNRNYFEAWWLIFNASLLENEPNSIILPRVAKEFAGCGLTRGFIMDVANIVRIFRKDNNI